MAGFRRDDPDNLALNVLDINLDNLALPVSDRPPSPAWRPTTVQQQQMSTKGKDVEMVELQDRSSFLLLQHDKLFTYNAETEMLQPRGPDLAEGRSGAAVFIWEDEDDVFDCSMLD